MDSKSIKIKPTSIQTHLSMKAGDPGHGSVSMGSAFAGVGLSLNFVSFVLGHQGGPRARPTTRASDRNNDGTLYPLHRLILYWTKYSPGGIFCRRFPVCKVKHPTVGSFN